MLVYVVLEKICSGHIDFVMCVGGEIRLDNRTDKRKLSSRHHPNQFPKPLKAWNPHHPTMLFLIKTKFVLLKYSFDLLVLIKVNEHVFQHSATLHNSSLFCFHT